MPTHELNSTAARPAATLSTPGDRRIGAAHATIPQPAPPPARVNGEDRRRSQRVLLRIRADVHISWKGKTESFGIHTLSVNPYGAMLISPRNLLANSRLVLEHGLTQERVACRVVRSAVEMPEGFHIPVEFDMPAPGFWKIAFPPEDWKIYEDL
jgi:hypothetical protein